MGQQNGGEQRADDERVHGVPVHHEGTKITKATKES
jgi:hypothetical protein